MTGILEAEFLLPTSTLQPFFNFLKGDKSLSFLRTLSPEAVQALNSVNAALKDMALARYDPTKPIQLLISFPTLVGVLYQPWGVLEWLHARQFLNEVDALTN